MTTKQLVIVLSLCMLSGVLLAQDKLILLAGDTLDCKIVQMNKETVLVEMDSATTAIQKAVPKQELLLIQYQNGIREFFRPYEESGSVQEQNLDSDYWKGVKDAGKYYKDYKSAGTATCVVTVFSPVMGLVPAIVCSSTPPSVSHLGVPTGNLLDNPHYMKGYMTAAKKIKSRKVWNNWGIVAGIYSGIILISLLSSGVY